MDMVPNGWRNSTLGQIASFKNGLNFNKTDNGERIKIVGVGDFKGLTELKSTDSLEYVQVDNKVTEDELLKSGDLLFVRSNGNKELIGRCLYFPEVNERMSYSGFTIRARVNTDKMLPEYASNLVRSSIVIRQIFQYGGGTNISNLSQQILNDLAFLIPPLSEQKKIAQILSTWDKAIATTEKLLENSQKQKQALMQQLLTGKKRFSGFNDKWLTKSLSEIGEIRSAGVDKNILEDEKPVRLLNFTDVFNKSFIYSAELNHWVTAPDAKVLSCDVKKGDVFFTPSSETRNEVAIPAVAAEDISDCCYSYHVVRFRLHENWDLNFKAYIFTTPEFRKQAYMLADGSGQRYVISQDSFRSIKITYPTYQEQVLIGKTLKAAEDEVNNLKQKIIYLKEEKKALMQQLLTGKRRVRIN